MNEKTFVAIDFETATLQHPRHICQIGLVFVKDGEIVDRIMRYVQPPENYIDKFLTSRIHRITPEMTLGKQSFPEVWSEIRDYFKNYLVVAHNSSFDETVLYENLEYHGISEELDFFECTFTIFGYGVDALCEGFGIDSFNHHDALFDAECCARFYLNHLDGINPDWDLVKERVQMNKVYFHDPLKGDVLKKELSGADPENPFYNKKVVVTGLFDTIERIELGDKLKSMGADVDGGIGKKTDYVLTGREAGPAKMRKIEELNSQGYNIVKIYEDELKSILSKY